MHSELARIGIFAPELMGIRGLGRAGGQPREPDWPVRATDVPLIVIMIVALIRKKRPILLGRDLLIFKVHDLDTYGFWGMAHETRPDSAMLLAARSMSWSEATDACRSSRRDRAIPQPA